MFFLHTLTFGVACCSFPRLEVHVKTKNLVSAHFVGSVHMILKIVNFKTDEMLLKTKVKQKMKCVRTRSIKRSQPVDSKKFDSRNEI